MNLELARVLRDGGPWGQHFPEPLFDGEFILCQQKLVGSNHLKLVVAECTRPEHPLDAIWFNVDSRVWPNPALERARLVYRLDVNEFRGLVNVQLMVEHLEPL